MEGTNSQLDFRIKLLSTNNVVLVECKNYESEVFTPQIVDGRITLLNIIPNRRCCQIKKLSIMNFARKELDQTVKSSKEQNLVTKRCAFSAKGCLPISSPLANSTPAGIKQRRSSTNALSHVYSSLSGTDSTLPTPEPVRRAIPVHSIFEKSFNNLPEGVKVSGVYHHPAERTKQRAARVVMTNNTGSSINDESVSLLDGSFRLPCSPILSSHNNKETRSRNLFHSTPMDCIARWEKVLTPVRTYTRKSKNPVTVNGLKTEKKCKGDFVQATPSYLHNPTQSLNVSRIVEIKKCKLIRDKKTSISPRSFKKQQTESLDAHTMISNLSLHPHSLSFHKPRSYLETMGMSAFDLLTRSNRYPMISRKLNKQFRKGCVNKASSTHRKYKVLSAVPPIQQDEQVLELSLLSMEASQPNE